MQCLRVTDCRDPEEADFSLLTQALECRYDFAEHLSDAKRRSVFCPGNRIVQMEDIDVIETQSDETAFQRYRHRVGDAAEIAGRHPNLGADGHIGGLQLSQKATEILLRLAIAVLNRSVEVIDAGGERPRNGSFLVGRVAAHHEAPHSAAAEA